MKKASLFRLFKIVAGLSVFGTTTASAQDYYEELRYLADLNTNDYALISNPEVAENDFAASIFSFDSLACVPNSDGGLDILGTSNQDISMRTLSAANSTLSIAGAHEEFALTDGNLVIEVKTDKLGQPTYIHLIADKYSSVFESDFGDDLDHENVGRLEMTLTRKNPDLPDENFVGPDSAQIINQASFAQLPPSLDAAWQSVGFPPFTTSPAATALLAEMALRRGIMATLTRRAVNNCLNMISLDAPRRSRMSSISWSASEHVP